MTDRREAPVQFRDAAIAARLRQRARPGDSPGSVAAADLARYHALLDRALAALALAPDEAAAVVDALNGTWADGPLALDTLLWVTLDDAVRLDGLAAKWGIDGPALVARLRALDPIAATAVVDAAERFWAGDLDADRRDSLRRVGLVR